MKTIPILILICLTFTMSYGQVTITNPDNFKYVNDPSLDYYFYISEKPVTNLDYLTYLCWIHEVYSDYPDVIVNAFPSLDMDSLSSSQIESLSYHEERFEKLISYCDPNIANYLFDHLYINYPVLGLSLKQIHNFSKWLTDRYNEYYAIQKEVFIFDPFQILSENFSTESYLHGQYEGLLGKNGINRKTNQARIIVWSDNYFIPTFRLPTHYELSLLNTRNEFKEYKGFKFLKPWIEYYIVYNKNGLTLKRGNPDNLICKNYQPGKTGIPQVPEIINEYTITASSSDIQSDLKSIYQSQGQISADENLMLNTQKDSLGHMPLQIISAKSNRPIYATPPNKNDYQFPMTFRLVVNELK